MEGTAEDNKIEASGSQENEKQKVDQEEEAKYEMSLYYDEEMSKHIDNYEELHIRCKVVYDYYEIRKY